MTTSQAPQPSSHRTPVITTQVGNQNREVVLDPARGREVAGSAVDDFNLAMIRAVMATARHPNSDDADAVNGGLNTAMAALAAFKPTDEIEGMLAAQAVALHFGAMECFRRAVLVGQQADTASKLRRDGANLARGVTDMLEALDRKRGKGPQVVRVERVVVHEGGQAIVGSVTAALGRGEG
jgi:hypothetical protein